MLAIDVVETVGHRMVVQIWKSSYWV